jgi:hypothetical protein
VTSETVFSWVNSLSLLTQSEHELSDEGIGLIKEISSTVTSSASTTSPILIQMLQSLDPILSQPATKTTRQRQRKLQQTVSALADSVLLFDKIGGMLVEKMVPGESTSQIFQPSFRLSAQIATPFSVDSATNTITPLEVNIDQTAAEIERKIPRTICTLNPTTASQDQGVSILEIKSTVFDGNTSSNPLSIQLTPSAGSISSIVCALAHNSEQHDLEHDRGEAPLDYLNVTCGEGELRVYEKVCSRGGNLTISLSCNGTATVLSKRCPLVQASSECVNFGSDYNCNATSYNSSHTICTCTVRNSDRRALSSSEATVLQVRNSSPSFPNSPISVSVSSVVCSHSRSCHSI